MSALALSAAAAAPRLGPRTGLALAQALAAALPGWRLVDLAAPAFPFASSPGADGLVALPHRPADAAQAAARTFLSRFRQRGGALPLYLRDAPEAAQRLERLADALDGAPALIAADGAVPALGPEDLGLPPETGLLLRAAEAPDADLPLVRERASILLRPRGIGPALPFRLLLPPASAREAAGRLAEMLSPADAPGEAFAFELPVPARPGIRRDIPALGFIHDGAWRAEGDAGYSWLWTGPSAHFRLMLGRIGAPAARIHVCIINTLDERNMGGLRVLLDGCPVEHGRDVWSPTSGKLIIEVPNPAPDMTVLSIVVPHMVPDADGVRQLGLCLDKIEVLT